MPDVAGGERIGMAYVDLSANTQPMKAGLAAVTALLNGWVVKTQADMDTAMRNIWTIVDTNHQGIARFQQQIVDLARTVPQSQKQLAEGFYQLVSASVAAEDAMYVLEVSAKAASAGMSSTFTAVDAITTVLNAYSIDAEKAGIISDIMFKTVEKGKLTFEQLAAGMGGSIATAAAAGVSFEEVAAAFATMTRSGISADEASTALNQTMLSLISPATEAMEISNQLGVEWNLTALQSKGLVGVLKDMMDATGGNVEVINKFVPNVRALKGVLNLAKNDVRDFAADLEIMENAAGAADIAFSKQAESINNAITLMKNALNEFALTTGKSAEPAVRSLASGISDLARLLATIPEGSQKVILATAMLASTFGVLQKAIASLITTFSGPVGWIALVGLATAAIVGIKEKTEKWNEEALKVGDKQAGVIATLKDQAEKSGIAANKLGDLIGKYEELAGKSTLTKDEQNKLNAAVQDIGKIAPGVVSAWDDMGRAIGINIDAAKTKLSELYTAQRSYSQMALNAANAQMAAMESSMKKASSEVTKLQAEFNKMEGLYLLGTSMNLAPDKSVLARSGAVANLLKQGFITSFDDAVKYVANSDKALEEAILNAFKDAPAVISNWTKLSLDEQFKTIFTVAEAKAKEGQQKLDRVADLSSNLAEYAKLGAEAAKAKAQVEGLGETINNLGKNTTGTGGKANTASSITEVTTALSDLVEEATSTDVVLDVLDNIRNMIDIPGSSIERLKAVAEAIDNLEKTMVVNDATKALRTELENEIKLREEANRLAKAKAEAGEEYLGIIKATNEEIDAELQEIAFKTGQSKTYQAQDKEARDSAVEYEKAAQEKALAAAEEYWDEYADLEISENAAREQRAKDLQEKLKSVENAGIQANKEALEDEAESQAKALEASEKYWDEYAEMEAAENAAREEAARKYQERLTSIMNAALANDKEVREQAASDQAEAQEAAKKANEEYWDDYAEMEKQENLKREEAARKYQEMLTSILNAGLAADKEAVEQGVADTAAAQEAKAAAEEAYWNSYADMEKQELLAREERSKQIRAAEENSKNAASLANKEALEAETDYLKASQAIKEAYWDEYADMEKAENAAREARSQQIQADLNAIWDEYAAMEKEEIRLKVEQAAAARKTAEAEAELLKIRQELAKQSTDRTAQAFLDIFSGMTGQIGKARSGGFATGESGTQDLLREIFEPFSAFAKSYWESVYANLNVPGTSFDDAVKNVNKNLTSKITESGMSLANALQQIGLSLQEAEGKIANGLGDKLVALSDKLGSKVTELAAGLGVVGMVIGVFATLFGWMLKAVDWFERTFKIGYYDPKLSDQEREYWKKLREFWGMPTDRDSEDEGDKRAAFQISEISGPMRDSIVQALDPLKVMYSYPTYKNEIVAAIYAVRDAVIGGAALGTTSALAGIQQTFNIQQVNITAANGETFSAILSDLDRRTRLAVAGAGGD